MKKFITMATVMCFCMALSSQTLNLVMGSTITNERNIFQRPDLSRAPIPFFTLGMGYTHTNNTTISLAYAFDLKVVTFTCSVPIYAFKKRRNCFNFALANNNMRMLSKHLQKQEVKSNNQ